LPVRITIQADSLGTSIIWQELHSSVTTNGFGLITLILGKGARQAASTVATFSAIDWSVTPKFIKTEISYSGWKTMGVTRFWSVPYSLNTANVTGTLSKLAVKGRTALNDEALFEVKNKDGQTVFAVYNEGVRVYVADGAKGLKGGFAVGGFGTDKAESQKYMVVSKDSVRIYLDTNPLTKGPKGGFAVGGYDLTKAIPQEYLRVTQDSTRINVNNNPAKGQKGGFAVGGFDVVNGTPTPFTSLTPKNYFIGHEAGRAISNGVYNLFLGYNAGRSTTGGTQVSGEWQGCNNIFVGYNSGYGNTTGYKNVFIGYQSGKANTSGVKNTFIGNESGVSNLTGGYNTFLGYNTGIVNSSGSGNSFIGADCGFYNTTAYYNTCMGTYAGENLSTGSCNTFIGAQSGHGGGTPGSYPSQFVTGNYTTAIGYQSGYSNVAGSGNVFLGYRAGYSETGSNKLYIANSSTNPPLIYGDFSTGSVGIGTISPSQKLEVNGNIQISVNGYGIWLRDETTGTNWQVHSHGDVLRMYNGSVETIVGTQTSSRRWKDSIKPLENMLEKINQLQGVTFRWKTGYGNGGNDLGFIAEEVGKVFPELVTYEKNGTDAAALNYPVMSAIAIEGIKELSEKNTLMEHQIAIQQNEIDELKALVKSLLASQTTQGN
jgi:hypothetical protein